MTQEEQSMHEHGRYTGRLILEPLPDGRRMRTVEDFGFMEPDELHWPVPPKTTVDGASIPQPLWSLIGGPFEGKYRDASVVHDYYCDVRSANWKMVHRVFYRAMLVSGVSVPRAKLMYAAVYFAGPRWSPTVEENVRLGPPAIPKRSSDETRLYKILYSPLTEAISNMIERDGKSVPEMMDKYIVPQKSEVVLQLEKLSELVVKEGPSLRGLEFAIDEVLTFLPGVEKSTRALSTGHLTNLDSLP